MLENEFFLHLMYKFCNIAMKKKGYGHLLKLRVAKYECSGSSSQLQHCNLFMGASVYCLFDLSLQQEK